MRDTLSKSAGMRAGLSGLAADRCPVGLSDPDGVAWLDGWREGHGRRQFRQAVAPHKPAMADAIRGIRRC